MGTNSTPPQRLQRALCAPLWLSRWRAAAPVVAAAALTSRKDDAERMRNGDIGGEDAR
jgi:hypothetical protein